jgi:NADPH-dependent 2,4-dienoyl-CoA reductase/sulfur reductase-like enzyme
VTEALPGSDLLAAIPELSPLDPHNQRLVENVHPPGWVNPDPKGRYNLVVVGAGTAGLVTAAGAAGLGARVALVERRLMGGDCLNVGCVPSKALIRAARAAAEVNRAGEFGVMVPGGARVNFARVQVVEQPGVFAAGDCAALREFPETPKAGVYAVRQGPVLASNLRALLDGRSAATGLSGTS